MHVGPVTGILPGDLPDAGVDRDELVGALARIGLGTNRTDTSKSERRYASSLDGTVIRPIDRPSQFPSQLLPSTPDR